jgi:membrane-associated phospholipid phosphatase
MIICFISTAVVVALCICFYDRLLAICISKLLFTNSTYSKYASDIPDMLLLIVCGITAFAFIAYRIRIKKKLFDKHTEFFHLIMYAVPASYVVKSLLKCLFGRTNTREWLLHPESYGFHWFQGYWLNAGFPSGHMAVFTTLAVSLWRFYPRCRVIYSIYLLTMAVALIATNYHFISDVIAGAYVGMVVEACLFKSLGRQQLIQVRHG